MILFFDIVECDCTWLSQDTTVRPLLSAVFEAKI